MSLLRCPACRAPLPASATIDEEWLDGDPPRWIYKVHCRDCLTISRQELESVADPRRQRAQASVELPPAVVVRRRERMQEASRAGRLAEARRTPEGRLLLRAPEVFAVLRPTLGSRVAVVEPAWFTLREAFGPQRVSLHGSDPDLAEGAVRRERRTFRRDGAPPAFVVGQAMFVEKGAVFALRGLEETRLLLAVADPAWSGLEALLAWPDQVEPV